MKKKLITFFLLVEDVTCCKGVIYGIKNILNVGEIFVNRRIRLKTASTRKDKFFAA